MSPSKGKAGQGTDEKDGTPTWCFYVDAWKAAWRFWRAWEISLGVSILLFGILF